MHPASTPPHPSGRPVMPPPQGAPPPGPVPAQGRPLPPPHRAEQPAPARHDAPPTTIPTAKVGRRWLPWRSRTRRLVAAAWDLVPIVSGTSGDDPISALLGILSLIFAIPAMLLTPFFLIELLLQLLCLPFALLARAFGWLSVEIDVRRESGDRDEIHRERVRGWGAARRRVEQIRQMLAHGARPPFDPGRPFPS